jgi:hypothetical protein
MWKASRKDSASNNRWMAIHIPPHMCYLPYSYTVQYRTGTSYATVSTGMFLNGYQKDVTDLRLPLRCPDCPLLL